MKQHRYFLLLGLVIALFLITPLAKSQTRGADGVTIASDDWLLGKKSTPWQYTSKPSPTPVALSTREPTKAEQLIIERARALIAGRPAARAVALMDGDAVLYSQYNGPANADSIIFAYSMGKTVTAMAVGKAICSGHLKLETKASQLLPELNGKALGDATVHDLLRMASGTTEGNAFSSIWTETQGRAWLKGELNLVELVSDDRVAKAAKGIFSDFKPGEQFSYKATDPILLGIMVSRAASTPWSQWLQENVLNPMGAAQSGLYVLDDQKNGKADSGMQLRLEDWMRFALWVKRSSKESGCFGDYVRTALSRQIANGTSPQTRKFGALFAGYGYFIWTDNAVAPNTSWAAGWGGQRISWTKNSDRMVIVFSSLENWVQDVYQLSNDWSNLR